jgi:2-iminobutanoate/2-iminopropanoate deaminase
MSNVTTHPSLRKVSTEGQCNNLILMPGRDDTTTPADAPAAIGPYVQAVVSPPFVFVSGCLGLNPKTGEFVDGGIEGQAYQALQNLKNVVEASGSEVGRVVKTTVGKIQPFLFVRSTITRTYRFF